MRRSFIVASSVAIALAATAVATGVNAGVVFSENFTNPAFQGAPYLLSSSDMWASVTYYHINSGVDGWTFAGDVGLAVNNLDSSQRGLLLNEGHPPTFPGGVGALTLTGLMPGQEYVANFMLSGDNEPFQAWVFHLAAIGAPAMTANGVDTLPGMGPGASESYDFTPAASLDVLLFYQASLTGASPIVTNLTVSTVSNIPEPSTWVMMAIGFAGLGLASYRKANGAARFAA